MEPGMSIPGRMYPGPRKMEPLRLHYAMGYS
jgi:hypothetical protein